MQLRPYQERGVTATATKLAQGKRKLIVQLATGGGKTVMFSAISQRFIEKSGKAVLILVHRKELLLQTRRTLYNMCSITAQPIVAGMRNLPPAKVYVGMVESVNNRVELLRDIGLVIIDEAHIAVHNKMHEHFPTQFIIGFTATPLSANRKKPLHGYYEDIICCVDIPELIKSNALCQNITRAPKDTVDRAALAVKNGEFNEGLMGMAFSKPRYVANTVKAYEKFAKGTKTIVFNVTIDHSRQVAAAFKDAGYNTRHLDSEMGAGERDVILQWFKITDDAVLNNVGILTAGFDEPTIETVIMNRCTLSMPLWLQITGRGSRPTPAKEIFTIIDLGGNALVHGDWNLPRDWENIFFNPPKPGEGVAPVKDCPECEAIVAAATRICPHCGHEFPTKEQTVEEELADFVIVTQGINVAEMIEKHKEKKDYFPFFKIGADLAKQAKNTIPVMTDDNAEFIYSKYAELAKEWCNKKGKKFNQWHQERAKEHLYTELASHFKKWTSPIVKSTYGPVTSSQIDNPHLLPQLNKPA